MYYVDEGDVSVFVVLLLYGEFFWFYLYWKMILILVEVGYWVIVFDLIGFGKFSKFSERSDYFY